MPKLGKKSKSTLRITGGMLKNKAVSSRKDPNLRPTTAKNRETMFTLLAHGRFFSHEAYIECKDRPLLQDAHVLDLFCGTGILGFEALSRGAASAIFVDQNADTLQVARENAQIIGVAEQCHFMRKSSTNLPVARQPVDIVFMDPPYDQQLATAALRNMQDNGWLQHGTLILLEQGKRDAIPERSEFKVLDQRHNDKTMLCVLQYNDSY